MQARSVAGSTGGGSPLSSQVTWGARCVCVRVSVRSYPCDSIQSEGRGEGRGGGHIPENNKKRLRVCMRRTSTSAGRGGILPLGGNGQGWAFRENRSTARLASPARVSTRGGIARIGGWVREDKESLKVQDKIVLTRQRRVHQPHPTPQKHHHQKQPKKNHPT